MLAQAEKLKADAATQAQTVAATKSEAEVSAAALKDKANKQSYANGVMFSRLVQKSMDQMADLGIKTNLPILLAGIKDGLAQKVAVEPKTLLSLHESMLKELSSREEKKYQAGIDQLEKATAKKNCSSVINRCSLCRRRLAKKPSHRARPLTSRLKRQRMKAA
ncbi:hypothetical protein CSE899_17652 [Cronobacter sakazakii E899]|nr:hypothetical protein CSE899_17652 [Cronobacter sakazakii E899]